MERGFFVFPGAVFSLEGLLPSSHYYPFLKFLLDRLYFVGCNSTVVCVLDFNWEGSSVIRQTLVWMGALLLGGAVAAPAHAALFAGGTSHPGNSSVNGFVDVQV
jgi:hypothetical protein